MANFFQFVEHWATIYKPMQHVPGETSRNKRFFMTNDYLSMVDFAKRLPVNETPSVVMENNMEGQLDDVVDNPEYVIYFMVKSSDMNDSRQVLAAKTEAKEHMLRFVSYLKMKSDSNPDVENYSVSPRYQTVGPIYNGWYGVMITVSLQSVVSQCVAKDDYVGDINLDE